MKGLKKLALASAVAAAPFAQAELVAMDDAVLETMTGQAGVTIELDTAITIGSFTYTDTDGLSASKGGTDTAGQLAMTGIQFGGSTVAGGAQVGADGRLDDLKIDIDVDGANGLIIHLGGTDSSNSLLGANPVDFGLRVDTVTASGVTGNIASDINIAGNLGPIDISIADANDNAATTDVTEMINVQAYFEVTSGSLNVDVMGLGITNLRIGQDSNPIVSGRYENDIRGALASALSDPSYLDGALVSDADLVTAINALPGQQALAAFGALDAAGQQAQARAAFIAAGGDPATFDADPAAATAAYAGGLEANTNAAVNPGNATNMAYVEMSIGNGSANYNSLTEGSVVVDEALVVTLESMNIDVSMDLTMGSTGGTARNLGNIALDDLNMSGTVMKIYGH